jgi:hypothetical protein
MIEQSVRREAAGTKLQPPVRRFLETLVLGDARRRGETHQWMYDRINAAALLTRVGFRDPKRRNYNESSIAEWNEYELDLDKHGNEYKTDSLYIEMRR